MNQTQSGRNDDRAVKRALYLIVKTVTFGGVTVLSALTLGVTAVGVLFMFGFSFTLASDFETAGGLAIVAVAAFAGAFYIGRIFVRELKDSRRIVHVPPVREQIAALPANKVLVRASDQPEAAPNELLRAAHTARAAAEEELLRASK